MKRLFGSAAVLALLAVAAPATAQQYQSEMLLALRDAKEGKCSSARLAADLYETCNQQMPGFAEKVRALGELEAVVLDKVVQSEDGPVEIYDLYFENGTMRWTVADDGNGKLETLWSPGGA